MQESQEKGRTYLCIEERNLLGLKRQVPKALACGVLTQTVLKCTTKNEIEAAANSIHHGRVLHRSHSRIIQSNIVEQTERSRLLCRQQQCSIFICSISLSQIH